MTDHLTTADGGYEHWHLALEGIISPIVEDRPQNGFYRTSRRPDAEPVAIWSEDGRAWAMVGNGIATDVADDVRRIWIGCAKNAVSEDDYHHKIGHGRWLTDPPAAVPPAAPKPDETVPPPRLRGEGRGEGDAEGAAAPSSPSPSPGPGHNSGDPDSFYTLRAELEGDIAEAKAHYARNPIKTKTDADKCENWRRRIYDAAKAMDEKRKVEKKPHDDAIEEIQARYKPVLDAARECAAKDGLLDKLGQAWIRAETERMRKEAEAKARAEHEARIAAVLEEQRRLKEEREAKLRDNPVAALTEPEPDLPDPAAILPPVVEAPKVMIGTGPTRRGAQATQHTAAIIDAKALATHLIAQRHPDLMECLQKIANAAARSKARTTLPGCKMSWEAERAA